MKKKKKNPETLSDLELSYLRNLNLLYIQKLRRKHGVEPGNFELDLEKKLARMLDRQ